MYTWTSGTARDRTSPTPLVRQDDGMDTFHEGQRVWVEQADGSQRPAIFVGEAEMSWFGGGPGAYVVYPDTRSGEEVALMRIVPREDDERA
jgi:hypothetical protein